MACTPAPACKTALAEATALYPNRLKASDGICASPQHTQQNPTSDHEVGNAVDVTHDPANGCDINVLFNRIVRRRDPRVMYLIWNRRMCRSYDKPGIPAWTWSEYTGSNPHTKHGHISIHADARNNTAPWFIDPNAQENDVNSEQNQWLSNIENRTKNAEAALQALQQGVADLKDAVAQVRAGGGGGGVTAAEIADELAKRLDS